MVMSYDDVRIRYHHISHGERSRARNFGTDVAKGDYVCFVDDDDYLLENHLFDFFTFLEAQEFPNIIVRSGYYREMSGVRTPTIKYLAKIHKNPVRFAAYNMCDLGTLCIPRLFLTEDRFPEEFWHFQDTHLILRLLAKHPFHQLDSYSYIYFIHQGMGSIFSRASFLKRADNNVDAIQNIFESYGDLLKPFLPKGASDFLLAEKANQHSAYAFSRGWVSEGCKLLTRANAYRNSALNLMTILRKMPGQIKANYF